MRKLVLILIAFIAVVTFIRAFDNTATTQSEELRNPPPSGHLQEQVVRQAEK